jgi:hypothetical protein
MIVVAVVHQALVRLAVPMVGVTVVVIREARAAVPERTQPHQVPELQLGRREVLRVGLPIVSACVAQLRLPTPSRANEG